MARSKRGRRRIATWLAIVCILAVLAVWQVLELTRDEDRAATHQLPRPQHDAAHAHAAPRPDSGKGDAAALGVTRLDGSPGACARRGQLRWSWSIDSFGLDTVSAGGSLVVAGGFHEGRSALLAFDTRGRKHWTLLAQPVAPEARPIVQGIAVTASERVMVTLQVSGVARIGNLALRPPSAGLNAACVAAFTSSGRGLWSTCLNADDVRRSNPALDSTGAVVFIGSSSMFDFKCGDPGDPGWYSSFAAKISASGTTEWCRRLGDLEASGLAVTSDDSVVIAGTDIAERHDLRLRKLDPNGAPLWKRRFPGESAWSGANASVVASSGSIYLGGNTSGVIVLGNGVPTLRADHLGDAFIARLDPAGRPLWARQFKGDDSQDVSGMAVVRGGLVITTDSKAVMDFGKKTSGGSHPEADADDIDQSSYLAAFDPSGRQLFSEVLDGANVGNLAYDSAGDLVVVGYRKDGGFIASYCF